MDHEEITVEDELARRWPALPDEESPRTATKIERQFLFTWDDGSQVLVSMWDAGLPSAAKRDGVYDVWGVPADGADA